MFSSVKQVKRVPVCKNFVRFRRTNNDDHWSVIAKKKQATDKALEHFDDFYKKVFGKTYHSIRLGLIKPSKYVALINNYSDTEKTIANLENLGALNMRTLFNLEKQYIKEREESLKRKQELEKIWNMDQKLEKVLEKHEIKLEEPDESTKSNDLISHSLEASLANAEYDSTRIVDSSVGISSAMLYEFIPATKIKGKEDYIPESQHYKYYNTGESFPVQIRPEYDIHFPEHLNVYCFEKSNHSEWPSPKRGTTGVYDYYLMDGGSILPVLALSLRPGQTFLDMCSAPGGKSLAVIQTLYPDSVICNDVLPSRVKRIKSVMEQYLYDFRERWLDTNKIKMTTQDARAYPEGIYDRILVDVPCTNDRHSLKENDNNWFKSSRIKERLKLPETQCDLLVKALKLVKPGGIVVYSTCSLSPIQNDGVVHMALKRIWEETQIKVIVKDLSPALKQTQSVCRLADQQLLRYGHLVLPYLPHNYGPTYFCKFYKCK